ncbi:MAG: M28 family peptidase [bacterium]
MNRPRALWLLMATAACAGAPQPAPVAAVVTPTGEISAEELRRDLSAFADDSMRGRETGTEDANRAARFIARRVERLGLEPAGDSLFLQRVPLQRESFGAETRITVQEGGRTIPLALGTDVMPLVNLGAGVPPARRSADGEMVFAGYGVATTKPKRDDLAGLELEGKIVVVVNGAPAGTDSATRTAMEGQSAVSERLARILPQRPAAVIILFTGSGSALYEQLALELRRTVTTRSAANETPDAQRPIPMILLGVARAGSPLLPTGWPQDDRAQALARRHFAARVVQERSMFTAYNVAAVVRGSDPALSRTFVAFGAHYDHIGIVPPVDGDSIANGADDDGSGSVALLAIARSVQQMPVRPKRSTLFVWHVGEEKGLLGSSWFVDHSTVPIDSIVAQLNADMIGRNDPSLLYVVGPRAAPNDLSKRLGAIVDSVNATEQPPFLINREWDSLTHPEHIYERSDHFNYARKGIPIVFFTTGVHPEYHKPGDEVKKIEFDKLGRVTRLMRDVGLAVANGTKRPTR